LTLLLNDFYLKATFGNFLTGKLSDVAGLIVFPIFIAYLFPKSSKWISLLTGVLFIIWKTPLVTPIIDSINQYSLFKTQRIIDYSDYWALIVLLFTHKLLATDFKIIPGKNIALNTSKVALTILSFFAICATTAPRVVEVPKGTIYIGKEYIIKKSKDETIEMIKFLGYNVDYHENSDESTMKTNFRTMKIPYYQTDNIIIYDDSIPIDTIQNVKYTLYGYEDNRTKIEIINITLSEDGNIQRWQTLKYLRKQYKKMLEKQLINEVKYHSK